MQTIWLEEPSKYDGSQLKPLENYLKHNLIGDSIVSWQGACTVEIEHMIDGEDLRAKSEIAGEQMLHFILELFQFPLTSAVLLQRLMAEILIGQITVKSEKGVQLERRGDDIFLEDHKLNISIATATTNSSLIHFGVNITNKGTPVATSSLEDFGIADVSLFAEEFMDAVKREYLGVKRAAVKVRCF